MAIIHTPYTQSLKILAGAGNWLTDPVKLALLNSSYTFSAAHTLFDNGANNATDPSFNELANGTGYTTGGNSLGSKTITNAAISASPVTFEFTAEKTFLQGVVYIDATIDTIAKPLLFHILFDDTGSITIPSVDFVVNWNVAGIATLTMV